MSAKVIKSNRIVKEGQEIKSSHHCKTDANKEAEKLNKLSNEPEKEYSQRRYMNIEADPAEAMAFTSERVWSWHED